MMARKTFRNIANLLVWDVFIILQRFVNRYLSSPTVSVYKVNTTLKDLDLAANGIGPPGAAALQNALITNTTLRALRHPQITSDC